MPTGRLPQTRVARTISGAHLQRVLITPRLSVGILYRRSSAVTLRRRVHTPHRNSALTLRHRVLTPRQAARIRRRRILPRLLATDRPAGDILRVGVEVEAAQVHTAAKPQHLHLARLQNEKARCFSGLFYL